ncbi:PREDICTED: nucleolar protein 56 isoform X2 [Polistes dominula]|uniref:Nucleolar protein 56 n=1 Tax=Polistes dominula TaxID=743375 RepID=A0ABM1J0N1_POLDO|nr:PREDICTED: nucleolar protein 56 isoform X1 [Polistes dominula]XP_015186019.1 PREDICTED: nucleolar protein 56 isoform X2 [Polistes dominula]
MAQTYVLYEHAAGYAVFSIKEFEEVGMLLPQVEASVTDVSRFRSVVKLVGFLPFKTALAALENVNSISEGIVPEYLQLFLDSIVPKSDKKNKIILGVSDPKLGASITEALGIKCDHTGAIPEIIRGIRFHFHNLIKGFTSKSSAVAQLGLGHSYSRAKVKFNVNRVDNMIIQSIALLDQLDKDINTFSMRIREWYSYHFPELDKIVPENYMFAKVAQVIKNRSELTEERLDELEQIVMDRAKAQAIIDASKSSMGMDIHPVDLLNIEMFAKRVTGLADYRKNLSEYLKSKMEGIAPNLATLIGNQVGARLIAHAGSLTNLAKYPASTVQILGAEKALFRALKTRGNTPKYGLLFHSTFIGRAGTKNKGRISRYLANKCSIASRIDCFTETPTNIFGEKLRQQVEDRLKFYETGEIPKKNIDVMQEALEEVQHVVTETEIKSSKKKKSKNQKRKVEELENGDTTIHENGEKKELVEEGEEPVKKKKKKNKRSKSIGETAT